MAQLKLGQILTEFRARALIPRPPAHRGIDRTGQQGITHPAELMNSDG